MPLLINTATVSMKLFSISIETIFTEHPQGASSVQEKDRRPRSPGQVGNLTSICAVRHTAVSQLWLFKQKLIKIEAKFSASVTPAPCQVFKGHKCLLETREHGSRTFPLPQNSEWTALEEFIILRCRKDLNHIKNKEFKEERLINSSDESRGGCRENVTCSDFSTWRGKDGHLGLRSRRGEVWGRWGVGGTEGASPPPSWCKRAQVV